MSSRGAVGLLLHCGGTGTDKRRSLPGFFQFRTTPDPTAEPMFTIYGKALPRRSEAKDSCLIRALIFIDDALGYKIGDVNYVQYLLLRNNIP